MRTADRDLRTLDLAALEAFLRARDHITGVDLDLHAKALQRHDEQIDRPRADGAAARQRHLRFAHAGDERRNDPEAGAHLGNKFIGRGCIDDTSRRNVHRLALVFAVARPLAGQHDINTVVAEDALEIDDVREARHVFKDQGFVGQQAGDHQRQGGVLGAGNRNGAVKRFAADDANAIHCVPLPLARSPIRRIPGGLTPARSCSAFYRICEPSA